MSFRIHTMAFCLMLLTSPVSAYDGFGADTVGGAAESAVVTVTSLSDSGPGTLRAAFATAESLASQSSDCSTTGLLIDFSVSGTISLSSRLEMRGVGCVTLDGGGDILVTGDELVVRDGVDIIVTGMRVRETGTGNDGIRFHNVDISVIANNSCHDAGDECYSIVDGATSISFLDNICSYEDSSIQRCLLVARFNPALPDVDQVTVGRNLFVDAEQRSPQIAADGIFVVKNNLVAEWGRGTLEGEGTRLASGFGNAENNLYWKFSASHEGDALRIFAGADYHISGNDSVGESPADVNLLSTKPSPFSIPSQYQMATVDADVTQCLVVAQAGARPLDSQDQAIMDEFAMPLSVLPISSCVLDVDQNEAVDVATDLVYISRTLLGLSAVPPSFRVLDPTIPSDEVIEAFINAHTAFYDLDKNGVTDVATDLVYISRGLLGLDPVPPSFRILDPTIPPDEVMEAYIEGVQCAC